MWKLSELQPALLRQPPRWHVSTVVGWCACLKFAVGAKQLQRLRTLARDLWRCRCFVPESAQLAKSGLFQIENIAGRSYASVGMRLASLQGCRTQSPHGAEGVNSTEYFVLAFLNIQDEGYLLSLRLHLMQHAVPICGNEGSIATLCGSRPSLAKYPTYHGRPGLPMLGAAIFLVSWFPGMAEFMLHS
uniref:Uncharacterized protein n=1 Tax=Trichuris muris TaxID=70415 RepID=A0A5S6Q6A7_TRIMR